MRIFQQRVVAQKCPVARKDEEFGPKTYFPYVEVQIHRPDAANGRFSATTMVPSSSGPGRWPLTPETRVRTPLGSPNV